MVACDDEALYVRFDCQGHPAKPDFANSYYHADSVEVFIDPFNDHFNYFQFAATAGGKKSGGSASRPLDSQRWERKHKSEPLKDDAFEVEVKILEDRWCALFIIPFKTLGRKPESGRPFGFNLQRLFKDPGWPVSHWNKTHQEIHAPWAFGILSFEERPKVQVERVDLGEIRLWDNRGKLELRNLSDQPVKLSLEVAVKTGEKEEDTFHTGSFSSNVEAGGQAEVPFEFPFDPEDYRWHFLHLDLKDENGALAWSGSYRFGRGQVGWLLPIDDRREGPPAENPEPSDPDFMRKKRRYIIRKLPRFERRTTTQGAPSDFTLSALDGSVEFDLMKPGALKRMADYIYESYDNDVDRLLGANYFLHQPAVMTYANAPTKLATSMGPLSVIRFGNAQCCCFAAALVGLLRKLTCEETGRPYRATRVGIPGHVTTVAEYRGKWVHLDPSVGRIYFLRDNKTLASMEDLLKDPELAGRAGKYLEAFHRKGSESPDAPVFNPPHSGVWPSGAPAE